MANQGHLNFLQALVDRNVQCWIKTVAIRAGVLPAGASASRLENSFSATNVLAVLLYRYKGTARYEVGGHQWSCGNLTENACISFMANFLSCHEDESPPKTTPT
jgi:hypothetical protein